MSKVEEEGRASGVRGVINNPNSQEPMGADILGIEIFLDNSVHDHNLNFSKQ